MMTRAAVQVREGQNLAIVHRVEEQHFPENVANHAEEIQALTPRGRVAYRGEYARQAGPVNVLDRVPKPSPRRHTGPLKDLLVGMLIGAGIMAACLLIGFVEVAWWGW